jgi:integrase
VIFQVLRRTFATNAQGYGNAKDVQTHLRHADIATTLGVYTQPIDANVRKLVNAVTGDVLTSKAELVVETMPETLTDRIQRNCDKF